jgi:hypothetical protein
VARPDALAAVKERLLMETEQTLVVSAIAGLGGLGKSVLATAVVLDAEVQARFTDGILWVTLGQNPDLQNLLGDWIRELDKSREAFSANTLDTASLYLGTLLAERRMLLVVDDVWNGAHSEWFRVGGVGCRVLVTTREARLAGADYYDLDLMSEAEAIELLRKKLGERWREQDLAEVKAFVKVLGYLPLALDLAVNQVRDGLSWGELRSEFEAERKSIVLGTGHRSSALKLLDSSEAWELLDENEQRKYSLQACFNLSLKRLSRERFEQFAWLGVLPEDVDLTGLVAAVLWDVPLVKAKKVLIDLRNRSFLTSGVESIEGELSYRVHDLMHDMARGAIESPHSQELNQLGGLNLMLPIAHREFLERYRNKATNRRWDKLPKDNYIHRHLTWHMMQANWIDEIHELLAMSNEGGGNAWFEICAHLGKPAIFIEDVLRAWELSESENNAGQTISIILQCRYVLIMQALNSLVGDLPVDAVLEFVRGGFWTIEQAWAYLEQMQSEKHIARAIQLLAPHLTKPLLSLAIRKCQSILNESRRADALCALSENRLVNYSDLLIAVQSIHRESERAWVLTSMSMIDDAFVQEALNAARSTQDGSLIWILSRLAKVDATCLCEVVSIIKSVENERLRARILIRLAAIDIKYTNEALASTRSIKSDVDRADALCRLAAIDTKHTNEALASTRLIKDDIERAKTLCRLTTANNTCTSEALIAIDSIQADDYTVSKLLIHLVTPNSPFLSDVCLRAQSIQNEYYRAKVLISLALVDANYLSEALNMSRSIKDKLKRSKALSQLIMVNPACYLEALAITRMQQNNFIHSRILKGLIQLDRVGFPELLAMTGAIQDEPEKARVLTSLVRVNGAEFSTLLSEAQKIQDELIKAKILIDLTKVDNADFSALLAEAQEIQDESTRAETLMSLTKVDNANSSELLAEVQQIQNESTRAKALISLARVDNANFSALLAEAQGIHDESTRAKALISLARVDNADFSALLAEAQGIQDESRRMRILRNIKRFDDANLSVLLSAAGKIRKETEWAEFLVDLAKVSTHADFHQLFTVSQEIQSESARAMVLISLAKISTHAEFHQLLAASREIQSELARVEILSSLAEIDSTSLLLAANEIRDESLRTKILIRLARETHQNPSINIWREIERITHLPTRAEALSGCLPYFPLDQITHAEWCKYLHLLAYHKRSGLIMEDLVKLYPAILHLGGETAMSGVVDAMKEVCNQWK